jgi:hypothetical protein
MGGQDGETANLQYFSPEDMPVLSMEYPQELFINRELSQAYFDWDETWLNV